MTKEEREQCPICGGKGYTVEHDSDGRHEYPCALCRSEEVGRTQPKEGQHEEPQTR